MANLLELAQKMGIKTASDEVERKPIASTKRRPWLEEEKEEVESSKVKKGELKKPETPLRKLDKKLERVEKRTDQLLEKAQKQELRSLQIKNKSLQIKSYQEQKTSSESSRKQASMVEFYCLKGLPKSIINHIKSKALYDESLNKWISVIDTEELKTITNKTASHLSVQVLRLEKQGWFIILKSNNAGVRVLELESEVYSLKQ